MKRISVTVLLKTGKKKKAFLECRDHGFDLRFFQIDKGGGEIDADSVESWALTSPEYVGAERIKKES